MDKYTAYLKKQGDKYTIVASDKSIDRDNERILPSAFKNLKTYLAKNPVILFGHDYNRPPVGKAVKGKITDNELILDIEFADTGFGKEIKYLYDEGFMNTFSVGFIPKNWELDENGYRTFTEAELLEVSAVPVPANPNATILRTAKEFNLNEIVKVLDNSNQADQPKGSEKKKTFTYKYSKLWSK
jgi:HK97 family phage prohead protease